MLNCLLHSSLTRKCKNEIVIFCCRNHFYFLHCSYFQKQIFLGVLQWSCSWARAGLVYSKHRNIERVWWWIKSPLLSQLSRNVALWKWFYLAYNLGHNILELYNVLVQIQLTTSKTKRNILYSKLGIELPHKLTNNLRLRILGITEILGILKFDTA